MGAPPEDEMERAYGTSTGTGLGTSLHPRIVTLERAPPQKGTGSRHLLASKDGASIGAPPKDEMERAYGTS
jgi:hypothetical protein